MKDKANSIIHPLVITKSMVATFMGYNPDPSADTTLKSPINRPCKVLISRWKQMDIIVGYVVEKSNEEQVIHNI